MHHTTARPCAATRETQPEKIAAEHRAGRDGRRRAARTRARPPRGRRSTRARSPGSSARGIAKTIAITSTTKHIISTGWVPQVGDARRHTERSPGDPRAGALHRQPRQPARPRTASRSRVTVSMAYSQANPVNGMQHPGDQRTADRAGLHDRHVERVRGRQHLVVEAGSRAGAPIRVGWLTAKKPCCTAKRLSSSHTLPTSSGRLQPEERRWSRSGRSWSRPP